MKKPLIIGALSLVCIAVALLLSRKETAKDSKANAADHASVKTLSAKRGMTTAFYDSAMMQALRDAVSSRDGDALDRASKDLIDYMNAHPEQVDDYASILRGEMDEHVLRRFALALAETEAGLLENDKIIDAAKEMAKDSSFEQRQHIMLHLMSSFPDAREDVLQTVVDVAKQDPNSQVKTSSIATLADWMQNLPDKTGDLLGYTGDIYKGAKDDDVILFAEQVFAMNPNGLPPEIYEAIRKRLLGESDPSRGLMAALALGGAPEEIRSSVLQHVQNQYASEKDLERQRDLLLQIVFLGGEQARSLLQTASNGDSLLAQDAQEYLKVLSTPEFEPSALLLSKATRDPHVHQGSCDHPSHKTN